MTQYISNKPRRSNDRSWALTMCIVLLIVISTLFAIGYFWTRHLDAERQLRAQQIQFQTYQANTRPPVQTTTTPPEPSPEVQQAQAVRERLLNHPGVIPGRGFDKPGVQSTAIAIVDAIDSAQERNR